MASAPGPVAISVAVVTSLLSALYLAGPPSSLAPIEPRNETAENSVKEVPADNVHVDLQQAFAENWWIALPALALSQLADLIFYWWLCKRCKRYTCCKRCRRNIASTVTVRRGDEELELSVTHEKGDLSLSAVHCANNLLQTTDLTPGKFDSHALKLSLYSTLAFWRWAGLGLGNYSEEVLLCVIKQYDERLQWKEYALPEPEQKDVSTKLLQKRLVGFICCSKHQRRCSLWASSYWYAIISKELPSHHGEGKLDTMDEVAWCNCDPKLNAPHFFGTGEDGLRAVVDHLAGLQAAGGKVLIVWRE